MSVFRTILIVIGSIIGLAILAFFVVAFLISHQTGKIGQAAQMLVNEFPTSTEEKQTKIDGFLDRAYALGAREFHLISAKGKFTADGHPLNPKKDFEAQYPVLKVAFEALDETDDATVTAIFHGFMIERWVVDVKISSRKVIAIDFRHID